MANTHYEELLRTIAMVEEALAQGYAPPGYVVSGRPGALSVAAERLGLSQGAAVFKRLKSAKAQGLEPDFTKWVRPKRYENVTSSSDEVESPLIETNFDPLIAVLRKGGPKSLAAVAEGLECSKGQALDLLEAARGVGMSIHEVGGLWGCERPHQRWNPAAMEYMTRDDNTVHFGITSDNHLASKQARLDVLESLYDIFAAEGVDRAFNGGNYLEGERNFNRFELTVHGLDAQIQNLVRQFPARPGIVTYAVSGDDHEAWWSQQTGLDIGRKVEQEMRAAGREDWVNAGFIEADFRIKNRRSGKEAILRICHPGGGSAYAISYKAQKYVESLEGGNKPAIISFGHWHKMFAFNYRGVWCMGSGCTKDQDIFMRKQQLEAHIGGLLVKATQDPRTGAIVRCAVEQIRYFDRGYYENGKFSYAGDVVQPQRSIGGI